MAGAVPEQFNVSLRGRSYTEQRSKLVDYRKRRKAAERETESSCHAAAMETDAMVIKDPLCPEELTGSVRNNLQYF